MNSTYNWILIFQCNTKQQPAGGFSPISFSFTQQWKINLTSNGIQLLNLALLIFIYFFRMRSDISSVIVKFFLPVFLFVTPTGALLFSKTYAFVAAVFGTPLKHWCSKMKSKIGKRNQLSIIIFNLEHGEFHCLCLFIFEKVWRGDCSVNICNPKVYKYYL